MLPPSLASKFPKLVADGAKKTSDATFQYNCIAWSAARDEKQWWQPDKLEPWFYWPVDLPPGDYAFKNFIRLFDNLGYTQCSDSHFEILYKKVAIYGIYEYFEKGDWGFSHVCDQIDSGLWTSKLGPYEDIQHQWCPTVEEKFCCKLLD